MRRSSSYSDLAAIPTDASNALGQTHHRRGSRTRFLLNPQETAAVRNFPIPSISAFIVLLERRATPLRLAGALAAAVVSFAMLFGAATARAQPSLDAGEKKLSHELRDIVKTGATPAARWVHDV